MKIAIGNDRKGLQYKRILQEQLSNEGHDVINVGTDEDVPCDYPIYAERVARLISSGECAREIVICASGIIQKHFMLNNCLNNCFEMHLTEKIKIGG